ncbi:MAG: hypothetical protein ACI8XO_003297 [Verrucomicrobiales bacterium]|jgi:hypothetical protein
MTHEKNKPHDSFLRSSTASELSIRAYVRGLIPTGTDADQGTVRFCHNGGFDTETRQSTTCPARPGSLQIGNWNHQERKLSGRVDDLAILARTMQNAEVHARFEAGNPYP